MTVLPIIAQLPSIDTLLRTVVFGALALAYALLVTLYFGMLSVMAVVFEWIEGKVMQ